MAWPDRIRFVLVDDDRESASLGQALMAPLRFTTANLPQFTRLDAKVSNDTGHDGCSGIHLAEVGAKLSQRS